MALNAEQLDELYTELCYGMTDAGDDAAPAVLARLCLLLMHELADAPRIQAAVRAALDDYARSRAPVTTPPTPAR